MRGIWVAVAAIVMGAVGVALAVTLFHTTGDGGAPVPSPTVQPGPPVVNR